jgi:hypothetical protein
VLLEELTGAPRVLLEYEWRRLQIPYDVELLLSNLGTDAFDVQIDPVRFLGVTFKFHEIPRLPPTHRMKLLPDSIEGTPQRNRVWLAEIMEYEVKSRGGEEKVLVPIRISYRDLRGRRFETLGELEFGEKRDFAVIRTKEHRRVE